MGIASDDDEPTRPDPREESVARIRAAIKAEDAWWLEYPRRFQLVFVGDGPTVKDLRLVISECERLIEQAKA